MTEIEYINTTNLAKLRAAEAILRDVLVTENTPELRKLYVSGLLKLQALELAYARLVTVRG